MNTIREGRNHIVNAQHSNLRAWKGSIETFRRALDEIEQNQKTQRGLKTPRGIAAKWKDLIEKFVNDLNGFAIKKEQAKSVTQYFIHKSLPKRSSQEQDLSPERIKKVLTKISQREFKTPSQKLDNERLKRIKKLGDSIDPYNASTACNILVNKATDDLKALAYKLLAFFTAVPNDIISKGVELHNYCLEEKNLIPHLQAWSLQEAGNPDSEEYRLLRCWAKCLFDLRGIMNRYPDKQPPQKLAVAIKDINQPMDLISRDLCLAFFRAGKGKDAPDLIESPMLKAAIPACRTFLQDAKGKFEQIQRGDSLRYDVVNHAFVSGDNPLVVLNADEKSYHLFQLMHACCVNEMAKLSDLFPDQGVALDCYFEEIMDQKGWTAFDELDKCLAALNPSSQTQSSAAQSGQEVAQEGTRKKRTQRRLSFSAQAAPEDALKALPPENISKKSIPKLAIPIVEPQSALAAVSASEASNQAAANRANPTLTFPAEASQVAPGAVPASAASILAADPNTFVRSLVHLEMAVAQGARQNRELQTLASALTNMDQQLRAIDYSQLRPAAATPASGPPIAVNPPPGTYQLDVGPQVGVVGLETPAGQASPIMQKVKFASVKKPGNKFLAWLKNRCDWFNARIFDLMRWLSWKK